MPSHLNKYKKAFPIASFSLSRTDSKIKITRMIRPTMLELAVCDNRIPTRSFLLISKGDFIKKTVVT